MKKCTNRLYFQQQQQFGKQQQPSSVEAVSDGYIQQNRLLVVNRNTGIHLLVELGAVVSVNSKKYSSKCERPTALALPQHSSTPTI